MNLNQGLVEHPEERNCYMQQLQQFNDPECSQVQTNHPPQSFS